MGRLGYSTITLTDLTETIPVTLVLETNQPKNIQTKAGSLYNPDFTQVGGELIITPTLFLGQEDLHIENQKDKFVDPHGRENGFIYYQVEVFDENSGLEKNYYYGSSDKESGIWVDEQGRLHYQKNLTENLTIEAYIDKFQNEEHSYVIDIVQSINPIQFLFLEGQTGNFNLIVTSAPRQHFEDQNDSPIYLTAELYNGIDIVDTSSSRYTFSWIKVTDNSSFPSSEEEPNKIIVHRNDVYSEEKFICSVLDNTTGLSYSGSIDIWDLKEQYDCTIVTNVGLVTETTDSFEAQVNVYDSQGTLINDSLEGNYSLCYEWGFYVEKRELDGNISYINKTLDSADYSERKILIDFNKKEFQNVKNQTFSLFCNVYNTTQNSSRRLASEIHLIQFATEHYIDISTPTIFIPTNEDGTFGGEKKTCSFSFSLRGRDKNILPYNDEIDRGPINNSIWAFEQTPGFWEYKVTIALTGENDIWQDSLVESKYCEFTFVYCGYTYSTGVTIVKNIVGKSSYSVIIESSSGSTLNNADTETELVVKVYSKDQIIPSEQFFYKWFIDGNEANFNSINRVSVNADDFLEKAVYSCSVYADHQYEKIVGSAQYTLVDLTETLPVYLMLKSSLSQNLQTKNGLVYSPDFSIRGKEIIITPSLFVGQKKESIPADQYNKEGSIYYQVGDLTEEGKEIDYYYGSTQEGSEVWVDENGCLHYNKNLTKSITIEAYINNYLLPNREDKIVSYVAANNPINILFVETGGSEFFVSIDSGGREHFGEDAQGSIILTAKVYKGGEPYTGEVSYKWDIVTDSDDGSSTDFVSNEKSIEVTRDKISGTEIFICEVTVEENKMKYSATKTIRDFVDNYFSQIIAGSSLILSPSNSSVQLTNQVWEGNTLINDKNPSRFTYDWSILTADGQSNSLGSNKTLILTVGGKKEGS